MIMHAWCVTKLVKFNTVDEVAAFQEIAAA